MTIRQTPELDSPALHSSALRAAMAEPELSPLTSYLDAELYPHAELSDVAIRRMWSNIDSRPRGTQRKGLRLSGMGHWLIPAFSAALFVLAFFITTSLWDSRAPLAVSQGASAGELYQGVSTKNEPRQIAFADGSRIDLAKTSSLRVLSNSGGSFVSKLDRGEAVFHVTPGGSRRWIVEAGDVTVEVVGTVFTVNRDEGGVSVAVERGIVLVRGQVPGGEVRLTQGQMVSSRRATLKLSAEIDLPSKKPAAVMPERNGRATSLAISLSELADEVPGELPDEVPGDRADEVLGDGESDETDVKSAAGADTTDPSRLTLTELLDHADAARRAGNNEKAATYFYLASLRADPGDARRGIAALSFARVSSDQTTIVRTLVRGLSTMPPSLREPALARLVRAAQKAGNAPLATKYAHMYLEEFPVGPRIDLVKSWAGLP